jgi:hypothetical protein
VKKRTEYHVLKDLASVQAALGTAEKIMARGYTHHREPATVPVHSQAGIRLKKAISYLRLRELALSMELYHVLNSKMSFLDNQDV